jgi:hypothetical protein
MHRIERFTAVSSSLPRSGQAKGGAKPLRRDDHRINDGACRLVRWAYLAERDATGSRLSCLEGEHIHAARPDNCARCADVTRKRLVDQLKGRVVIEGQLPVVAGRWIRWQPDRKVLAM